MTEHRSTFRRQVRALVAEWLEQDRFRPHCDNWLRGFDPEFSRALADRHWLGLTWPTADGGAGRSNEDRLVMTEELLRAGAPVAAHWMGDRQIGPAILKYGSAELKRRYLPRIIAGEVTFCLGMSETESGSDLASVRTVAEATEGGWRLQGGKIWTSHAHVADFAYVLARTDRNGAKHDGLSEFLLDMSADGVSVRPVYDLNGAHHFNEMIFDDVFIPADHLLGELGNGWTQVTEQLAFERGGMERVLSTYPLLEAVIARFPRPDERVAATLGAGLARLAAFRALGVQIARAMDAGQAPTLPAAILKSLGTTFEGQINDLARSLLAGEPDFAGDDAHRLLAEAIVAAPGFTIRGGTTEVLRTIIAKAATRTGGQGLTPGYGTRDDAELVRMAADALRDRGGEPPQDGTGSAWALLTELGWPTVGIPEDRGGSGGDAADLAVLLEATGRHNVSAPVAETAWAAAALADAGRMAPTGSATVVVGTAADARDSAGAADLLTYGDGRISGTARRVPWGADAQTLVCLAATTAGTTVAVLVDAEQPGITRAPGRNLAGEPRDTITFDDVPAELIADSIDPRQVLAIGLRHRTSQLLGALDAAISSTVAHITTREQFGRPLAAFQAVGSQLAQMVSELSVARAAHSLDVIGVADPDGGNDGTRAAAAFLIAAKAADEVARTAHQLHGAMGVTKEHPLHLSTRRLWSWRDEFGGAEPWARMVGEALLPGGPDAVWDWITGEDQT